MSTENLTPDANSSSKGNPSGNKPPDPAMKMIEDAADAIMSARQGSGLIDPAKLIAAAEQLEKMVQENARRTAQALQRNEEARKELLEAVEQTIEKHERAEVERTANTMKKLPRPVTAMKPARFKKPPSP